MQPRLFWHRPFNRHARWLFSFELPYSQLQIHAAGFPALEDTAATLGGRPAWPFGHECSPELKVP